MSQFHRLVSVNLQAASPLVPNRPTISKLIAGGDVIRLAPYNHATLISLVDDENASLQAGQ